MYFISLVPDSLDINWKDVQRKNVANNQKLYIENYRKCPYTYNLKPNNLEA